MSKLEKLIQQYCPDGVEYHPLWSLTAWDKKFNGIDKSKQKRVIKYNYLLAADLKSYQVDEGTVKLLTTNISNLYTSEELAGDLASEGEVVAIPWGGNPIVQYYKGRFLTADNRIATSLDTNNLNNKFLYYCMLSQMKLISSFYRGSGIKHPEMAKVLDLEIPVPPLPVQEEIVRVLDAFTELQAELQAELQKRKQQYNFYRDNLLNFKDINRGGQEIKWMEMSEIGNNLDKKRKPITAGKRESGQIPYYGASGIVDYVKDYLFDGDYLLVSEDGANLLTRTYPIAFSIHGKTWVNNHAHVIEFKERATRKYVEYYLNSIDLSPWISAGAQPKLTQDSLNKLTIPVPPLAEQLRIVSILDRFDTLTNDLTSGLPAEMEKRRQQYEFYRDKLLTFKRKEA